MPLKDAVSFHSLRRSSFARKAVAALRRLGCKRPRSASACFVLFASVLRTVTVRSRALGQGHKVKGGRSRTITRQLVVANYARSKTRQEPPYLFTRSVAPPLREKQPLRFGGSVASALATPPLALCFSRCASHGHGKVKGMPTEDCPCTICILLSLTKILRDFPSIFCCHLHLVARRVLNNNMFRSDLLPLDFLVKSAFSAPMKQFTFGKNYIIMCLRNKRLLFHVEQFKEYCIIWVKSSP